MAAGNKTELTGTIVEIIDVIDWRYVVLAGVVGAAAVFVLLAMIEHTDDNAPSSPLQMIDLDADSGTI